MRNKRIKKKILGISLSVILLGINIETCYAETLNFLGALSDTSTTPSEGTTEIPFSDWNDHDEGKKRYQYRYKKEIEVGTTITMNAYNIDGTSVIPNSIIIDPKKYSFKAGTWVGINVTEKHYATWKVYDFEYQEVKKEYSCKYVKKSSPYTCYEDNYSYQWFVTEAFCFGTLGGDKFSKSVGVSTGRCRYKKKKTCYTSGDVIGPKTIEKNYNEEYSCADDAPNGYTVEMEKITDKIVPIANNVDTTKMKDKTVKEVREIAKNSIGSSSGKVQYITNNKYPDDITKIISGTIEGKSYKGITSKNTSDTSGYFEIDYEFLEEDVCMNVKTSEVTYGRTCKAKNGEVQIKNSTIQDEYLGDSVSIWHYFIPLNTKSTDEFSLDVIENENKVFSVNQCEYFMKDEESYKNYIVPAGGKNSFVGDYNNKKRTSNDWKTLKNSEGCHISTKISFPISQEFYNETSNKGDISFKGFNFYYRPIDINNPFPNGIITPSLWEGWSEKKSSLKISDSYNSVSYIAEGINASEIRKYNDKYDYTSWNNMNVNGSSSFINTSGIVNRKEKDGYYALGCGPANSNKKNSDNSTNFKYQERCS